MQMRQSKLLCAAGLLVCAGVLAGCGGSDTYEAPAVVQEDTVPGTALGSSEAFTRYAAALADADGSEPLKVEGLVPPTSETAEPEAVQR